MVGKNNIHVLENSFMNFTTTKGSNFQESMKNILMVGQVFSLLPVCGISSKNAIDVRYVRKSRIFVYAALSLCGQIFMTAMALAWVYKSQTLLKSTTTFTFFASTSITMALFFKVAKRWPKLVQYIVMVEDMDSNSDPNLSFKCNVTSFVVLALALFEHIMSLLPLVLNASSCIPLRPLDSYETFVRAVYKPVFERISYHPLLGIICQIQSTFTGNFSDVFVICMSYYLASRLDQVNHKLIKSQKKLLPDFFWRSLREEYGRATQLVRKVDSVISGVVFVSFANNLFFICLQLYYSLENGFRGKSECKRVPGSSPVISYISAAYFTFSLLYLITRSIAVSLIASRVHIASRIPAVYLYKVPSNSYSMEVQRFVAQVNNDKVALSGLQFFTVTRGLLLTVAGTIVTYELVLFQLNTSPSVSAILSSVTSLQNSTTN